MVKTRTSLLTIGCMVVFALGSNAYCQIPIAKANALVESYGFAEYVTEDNAPIIDGTVDAVWNIGASLIETSAYSVDSAASPTTVDIMWNETGLYFLAIVKDSTVNSSDLVNLWVAETYYGAEYRVDDWASRGYDYTMDGAYYLLLNPQGEDFSGEYGGSAMDMQGKFIAAARQTLDGYLLEAYVPLTGAKSLQKGDTIGFEVSTDNYLSAGASRASYGYWKGIGSYWDSPIYLGEVLLMDLDTTNGSPAIEDSNDNQENSSSGSATDSSNLNSSNQTVSSDSVINDENRGANGCVSSVTTFPFFILILSVIYSVAKKKVFKRN